MPDERKHKDNEEELSEQEMSGDNPDRDDESTKEGKHQEYGEWNREDLLQKAGELGIEGRSKMDKQELIKAIRDH